MCSCKDVYSSIAGLSTTENRQSDMVANKIKCRTTRGMSWSHLTSITSGLSKQICLQDSSDHSLTLLSKTGPYISASWGGHLLDMSLLLPDGKKYRQAVILLEVSLTAFLSLWAAKGQNQQAGFFSGKREKIMLTLESPLFLFIRRVRGPVSFIERMADILILTVYFWLWC